MHYDDFYVGFSGSFTKTVTAEDNDRFAELSGDFNPVHFDDSLARSLGFAARVSNGFVQESRIAAALVTTFGSPDTVVVALEKNSRFLRPVYIGDEITATVKVSGRIEALQALKIDARCVNQNKEPVVETRMTIKVLAADKQAAGE